jgi:hypothetical protein
MQRSAKDNILEQDKRWMTWLRGCSRRIGSSGDSLLQEYAGDRDKWQSTLTLLRTEKADDWQFCRGPLSDHEIIAARERYLSQYVFVAGDNCSTTFVDAMLRAEDAQIRMRLDSSVAVRCTRCESHEKEIRIMQQALRARRIDTNEDLQLAAAIGIFQRYYICGPSYCSSRRDVRRTIERVMQDEYHADERLPASGVVWRRILRQEFGLELISNAGLPCRLRVIAFDAEGSPVDPEAI